MSPNVEALQDTLHGRTLIFKPRGPWAPLGKPWGPCFPLGMNPLGAQGTPWALGGPVGPKGIPEGYATFR